MKRANKISNFTLCTRTPWCVGATISGGIRTISLFRVLPSGRHYSHPVFDGMVVADEEAQDRLMLTHGFLVEHRSGWCKKCRRQHRWCHSRMSGGDCAAATHPYPGCEEAQAGWDAEDWTRRKVTCACGKEWFQQSYLLDDPEYDQTRLRQCWACHWEEKFPKSKWVA